MILLQCPLQAPALPAIADFPPIAAMPSLAGDFLPELHAHAWQRLQTVVLEETMSSKEAKPDDDVGSKGHKYR